MVDRQQAWISTSAGAKTVSWRNPNKTCRKSFIRSQINSVYYPPASLTFTAKVTNSTSAEGRWSIEVLRDAHRSSSWVMLGELNAIAEAIVQGEKNTGSWNLGHAFFKRWKHKFKWIRTVFPHLLSVPSAVADGTDKSSVFTWRIQVNGKLLLGSSPEEVIPVHCLLSPGKEDHWKWSCLCQERWQQHWLSAVEH